MASMPWGTTSLVREASLNQIFSIVVTLLLGLIAGLVLWRINLRRLTQVASRQSIPQSAPKLKSRRIRDIQEATTIDELRHQLGLCPPKLSPKLHDREDNLRLTFARSSSRFYMATMTSYETPKDLAYPTDTDFIGITPLFESSDADVE